jgi:hypothetical protein
VCGILITNTASLTEAIMAALVNPYDYYSTLKLLIPYPCFKLPGQEGCQFIKSRCLTYCLQLVLCTLKGRAGAEQQLRLAAAPDPPHPPSGNAQITIS